MEFLTGAVQKEDLGIAEILAGDYEGKNIKEKIVKLLTMRRSFLRAV